MGKLNSIPEAMERTCPECLLCVEIILRPATKSTNHIDMVPWEKRYFEGYKGVCKEKANFTRKMS